MVLLKHVTFWIMCAFVQISSAQVDGGLSEWSVWIMWSCPVTCGQSLTNATRTRNCTNPVPQKGGLDCTQIRVETEPRICNTNMLCPIDGGLSEWSEWTMRSCPVTCGQSLTNATRTRHCTNPVPQKGGLDCTQIRVETEPRTCNTNMLCPIDGGLSEWSEWIIWSCPVTCGQSLTTATRTRHCTNPVPNNGGLDCKDKRVETETRTCNTNTLCPFDGGLSSWTEWSIPACTESCGLAASSVVGRYRYCNNPEPQGGGQACNGPRYESQLRGCVLPACPKPPVDARIMAGVVIGVGLVLIFIAVAMTCNFFLYKERSPTGPSCEDNFRRSEFHEYNRMKIGFLDNKHPLSYRV